MFMIVYNSIDNEKVTENISDRFVRKRQKKTKKETVRIKNKSHLIIFSKNTVFQKTWKNGGLTAYLSVNFVVQLSPINELLQTPPGCLESHEAGKSILSTAN